MEWQSQEACDFSFKPHFIPLPPNTATHPPQEAGKEEVSYIDVHLIWRDFLPACENRHRGKREQKRSVGWGPRTQAHKHPAATQQPPSSQHELPRHRKCILTFSDSTSCPRVNKKPPHSDVLYFPMEIRFRVNTVTAAKAFLKLHWLSGYSSHGAAMESLWGKLN